MKNDRERTMKYRHDLALWRFKQSGKSYRTLAGLSGCGVGTVWDFLHGQIDPTASTIKAIFETLLLDTKYAMDFTLMPDNFDVAIVDVNFCESYAAVAKQLERARAKPDDDWPDMWTWFLKT